MAITIQVGRTKVDIVVRGCTICGTQHCRGWMNGRVLTVTIGKYVEQIEIPICLDCAREFIDNLARGTPTATSVQAPSDRGRPGAEVRTANAAGLGSVTAGETANHTP